MRFPKGYFDVLEKVAIGYEKIGLTPEDLGSDLVDALSNFWGFSKEERIEFNRRKGAAYKRIVSIDGGRQLLKMEEKILLK